MDFWLIYFIIYFKKMTAIAAPPPDQLLWPNSESPRSTSPLNHVSSRLAWSTPNKWRYFAAGMEFCPHAKRMDGRLVCPASPIMPSWPRKLALQMGGWDSIDGKTTYGLFPHKTIMHLASINATANYVEGQNRSRRIWYWSTSKSVSKRCSHRNEP